MGAMHGLFSGWVGIGCYSLRQASWLQGLLGFAYGGSTAGCCYSVKGDGKVESLLIQNRGRRTALPGRNEYRSGGEGAQKATNSLSGMKCDIPRGAIVI